jgi:pyruvate-ferredoxin/flavodoxin oxidoreductase
MTKGLAEQKNAVDSGHWPLYRYNPMLSLENKNPLQIDSKDPSMLLKDYAMGENRYRILAKEKPEVSERLIAAAQKGVTAKFELLKHLAGRVPK